MVKSNSHALPSGCTLQHLDGKSHRQQPVQGFQSSGGRLTSTSSSLQHSTEDPAKQSRAPCGRQTPTGCCSLIDCVSYDDYLPLEECAGQVNYTHNCCYRARSTQGWSWMPLNLHPPRQVAGSPPLWRKACFPGEVLLQRRMSAFDTI